MGEIPDGAMELARSVFLDFAKSADKNITATTIATVEHGGLDGMPMIQLAHIAILAERQRCAEVVRRLPSNTGVYIDRSEAQRAILNP